MSARDRSTMWSSASSDELFKHHHTSIGTYGQEKGEEVLCVCVCVCVLDPETKNTLRVRFTCVKYIA